MDCAFKWTGYGKGASIHNIHVGNKRKKENPTDLNIGTIFKISLFTNAKLSLCLTD
jgi:hypothetical protein